MTAMRACKVHRRSCLSCSAAVAAALATKVPALFGHHINPDEEAPAFYLRNASLFALPMLTLYFIWKRGWNALNALWFALPFLAAAVLVNVYPWTASPVEGRQGCQTPKCSPRCIFPSRCGW